MQAHVKAQQQYFESVNTMIQQALIPVKFCTAFLYSLKIMEEKRKMVQVERKHLKDDS